MGDSNVVMFSRSQSTQANNIGASMAPGHKKRENLFVNNFIERANVSYVRCESRGTLDLAGDIVNTNIYSDIAVQGSGMIPVSLTSSNNEQEVRYTRAGNFRQDKLGFWRNGPGHYLLGWPVDEKGNLPSNSSLLSSLQPVNFANIKGGPRQSSTVSVSMNLDARIDPLRGAGIQTTMSRVGLNATTGKLNSKDILLPEQLNSGSLSLGDSFTFTSSPPGVAKTVIYGAIAVANAVSSTTPILGAQNQTMSFSFGNGANQVPNNAQLKIAVGGTEYTFTAVQGSANADNKTFNNIQNLASAINKVSSLSARVDSKGRLYIAPVDPNKDVVFTDANGGTFKNALGLVDIPEAGAGVNRFNSLMSLQNAVNDKVDTYSLKATISDGDIKITSLLATADFNISGRSLGTKSLNSITRGDGTEQGRGKIVINSPAHGLQTGDMVRIIGLGGQTPDGIYAVGKVDINNFEIFVLSNNPSAAAGVTLADGFPALAGQPATTTGILGASWQKVPGQKSLPSNLLAGAVTNANPGGTNITITNAGHGLLVDDVIYVSGFGLKSVGGRDVNIPDGYYRVSNVGGVGGADFQITAVTNAVAAGAAPALAGFSYQKIGSSAGGFGAGGTTTFNSNVMVTDGGNLGPDSTVRLFTTSNNYNVGDYITFDGLAGGGALVDGVRVDNNTRYKVTAVNPAAGTIDFLVVGQIATTGDGATNIVGYGTPAFSNIAINNVGKLMSFFNIKQDQATYPKTYDPDNVDKSLSGERNFSAADVFTHPLKLYDSLGQEYTLVMKFAKLNRTQWAVELTSITDSSGNFEIDLVTGDGKVIAGTIEFDDQGHYTGNTNLSNQILIQRKNGSAPSYITLDWENKLSEVKSGKVTQYASNNNVEIVQQNGQSSGTLSDISVDPAGYIMGTFSSGEVRKLYQIPLAIFPNVNGLEESAGGTYRVTNKSGEVLLKQPGSGGAGTIIGGALENSNVGDTTGELLDLQKISTMIRANARAAGTENTNINTILGELKT